MPLPVVMCGKENKQTGIEKASAVYFNIIATRARKLLRSAML